MDNRKGEIMTEAKKTTTKKAPAKKTAPKSTPKVEEEKLETVEVSENKKEYSESLKDTFDQAKERGVQKAKKRKFDDEDLVPVASFASGETRLLNKKPPYEETYWEKFGDVEDVRYGTLSYLKNKHKDAFATMLYVLDEEAVEALGLNKVYDKVGKLEYIVDIFEKSLEEIIAFIDKSGEERKIVLREILNNKLQSGAEISYTKMKGIAEKLGMELNLDI